MADEWRPVLRRLAGTHTYDRGARAGHWVGIWVPVAATATIVGVTEAHIAGTRDVMITPAFVAACTVGLACGVAWIWSINSSRYVIDAKSVRCEAAWSFCSWAASIADIQEARLEPLRGGHWRLALRLRDGGSRAIVLTKSMRERLALDT